MNNLKVFSNDDFGTIRTVEVKNEPWFIGKDVAEVLGYSNPRKALADHVKDNHKNTVTIRDGIGNPNKTVIDEAGLYSLVMRSKLPTAERFQEWVTSEVIPAIRKTGSYELLPAEIVDDDEPQRLDVTQLELDQRIKIATIVASCRRERLALVAKILSLDVVELTPPAPVQPSNEELVKSFIEAEWDKCDNNIPCTVIYGHYKRWCCLQKTIPVSKNTFAHIMLDNFPVEPIALRYKLNGESRRGRGYRKLMQELPIFEEGGVQA